MLKVLIVDDEYIMRQGLKHMIDWEGEGYLIAGEATNGDEAIKLVKELVPDIIICDVVMPVLDGVDFTDAIHSLYPDIQIIILSGYDNFEYVKQTLMNGVVDYILKPTLTPDELKKVLIKASERIPGYKRDAGNDGMSHEKKLALCLLGQEEPEGEEFKKALPYGCYRFYAVSIRGYGSGLLKKLERSLKELQVIRYIEVTLREETAVVLFNYEMHDGPSLNRIIEDMNSGLCVINENLFGVISRSFDDPAEIPAVYINDIVPYVDKGFYYPETRLFRAEDNKDADAVTLPRFDFFRYNQLLNSRQGNDAVLMLKTYDEAARDKHIDPVRLKNQMKNLIYLFLDSMGIPDEEKENMRYEIFTAIEEAVNEKIYEKELQLIFDKLLSLTGGEHSALDERIESILKYIEENYRDELTLEDLAHNFGFNYNYLSTWFAQHMKGGFSDHLNRLRIQKACELLNTTDIPISQAGMEVGYSDHSYFSRVFRKYTGKTPSEWRRAGHLDKQGDRKV